MSSTKNMSFDSYINKLYCEKGQSFTHTRIADKSLSIKGGLYHISEEKEGEFYKKYYSHVFEKGNVEYLTEKQFQDNGVIAVDFDFRYDTSVKTRKHTTEHIYDMVSVFAEKIRSLLNIPKNKEIPVFIFEKPNVNMLENITKDGIHMIIGIDMDRILHSMLRTEILAELPLIWSDLPLTNSWEDVIDEGVVKGTTNWQLYGSKKPGNEQYILTHYFKIKVDDEDIIEASSEKVENFDFKNNFEQLSVRYKNNLKFEMTEEAKSLYERQKTNKKRTTGGRKMKIIDREPIRLSDITNQQMLDKAIESIMENLDGKDYEIKETHEFAMCLGKEYYDPYNNWIRVCFALRNTDARLFLTWVKFSSKSKKFSYSKISEMYDTWQRKNYESGEEILTKRSLMYWAKNDNPDEFQEIKKRSIDMFIEQAIETPTEVDCANILHNLKKDKFICNGIKRNEWYEFRDHRWRELDCGVTLRNIISTELHNIVMRKSNEAMKMIQSVEQGSEDWKIWKKKASKYSELCNKLKSTTFKNNIMRESMELFYDENFVDKVDANPNILCFNNGVVDFEQKTFRRGNPDDYCMKCTNIDYIKLDETKDKKTIDDIKYFFYTLFPIKELEKYMWSHLASSLMGVNKDHSFHIYTGSGSNGKSKLTELMSLCMGDYKAQVPITLVTAKRNSIGSSSSEVAQLHGVRYAVMQEPNKNERINEGIMKEITGGDPITARHLFKDSFTFKPMFKLVVATNHLFDIKSNDDGTWRRIRVCDFKSKFKKNANKDDEKEPYQFEIDFNLDPKLKKWAPYFMSMLVNICYEDQGVFEVADIVNARSDNYRNDQDYLTEFVNEKIRESDGDRIKKTELYETFKQWYNEQYGKNVPKGKDLYSFMDKKFGKYSGSWKNIEIIYDDDYDEQIAGI